MRVPQVPKEQFRKVRLPGGQVATGGDELNPEGHRPLSPVGELEDSTAWLRLNMNNLVKKIYKNQLLGLKKILCKKSKQARFHNDINIPTSNPSLSLIQWLKISQLKYDRYIKA